MSDDASAGSNPSNHLAIALVGLVVAAIFGLCIFVVYQPSNEDLPSGGKPGQIANHSKPIVAGLKCHQSPQWKEHTKQAQKALKSKDTAGARGHSKKQSLPP